MGSLYRTNWAVLDFKKPIVTAAKTTSVQTAILRSCLLVMDTSSANVLLHSRAHSACAPAIPKAIPPHFKGLQRSEGVASSLAGMSSQDLQAIVAAWQSGAISRDTMFELFRSGEILPDGRTNEDEAN